MVIIALACFVECLQYDDTTFDVQGFAVSRSTVTDARSVDDVLMLISEGIVLVFEQVIRASSRGVGFR